MRKNPASVTVLEHACPLISLIQSEVNAAAAEHILHHDGACQVNRGDLFRVTNPHVIATGC